MELPRDSTSVLLVRTRPRGWRDGLQVVFALVIRVACTLLAIAWVLHCIPRILEWVSADLAYALAGWGALSRGSSFNALLFALAWIYALACVKRWRSLRELRLRPGRWEAGRGQRPIWSIPAGEVIRVAPVSEAQAFLLTMLPGCPGRWRPVSGTLQGWIRIRTISHGTVIVPFASPATAMLAIRLAAGSPAESALTTRSEGPVRWPAALARSALVFFALPFPALLVVQMLDDPTEQGWISTLPARLAIPLLPPHIREPYSRTGLLRQAVAAGNPEVVKQLIDAFGPMAYEIDGAALLQMGCTYTLLALSELDEPPHGITREQRKTRAEALRRVLVPFEQRARLLLPATMVDESSVDDLVYLGNFLPRCQGVVPPYLRQEHDARALWPRSPSGELLPLPQLNFDSAGIERRVLFAISAGVLDPGAPRGDLQLTPLAETLIQLQLERKRDEQHRNPPLLEALHALSKQLPDLAPNSLSARDPAGRSIAHLAELAGESELMRLAAAQDGFRALHARTNAGDTLLHAAEISGNKKDTDWLIQRGLSIASTNLDGKTPEQVRGVEGLSKHTTATKK